MAVVGANLKRFRLAKGLTQGELADKVGVTLQTIYSYEAGRKFPRPDMIPPLAKALGIRPWQLLAEPGDGGDLPPAVVEHVTALAKACGLKITAR